MSDYIQYMDWQGALDRITDKVNPKVLEREVIDDHGNVKIRVLSRNTDTPILLSDLTAKNWRVRP